MCSIAAPFGCNSLILSFIENNCVDRGLSQYIPFARARVREEKKRGGGIYLGEERLDLQCHVLEYLLLVQEGDLLRAGMPRACVYAELAERHQLRVDLVLQMPRLLPQICNSVGPRDSAANLYV